MGVKDLKQQFVEITGMPAKKVFASVACGDVGTRRMMSQVDWEWACANIKSEFRIGEQAQKHAHMSDKISTLQSELIQQQVEITEKVSSLEQALTEQQRAYEQMESENLGLITQVDSLQSQIELLTNSSELSGVSQDASPEERIAVAAALLPIDLAEAFLKLAFHRAEDKDEEGSKKLYRQLSKVTHSDTATNKALTNTFTLIKDSYEEFKQQRESELSWMQPKTHCEGVEDSGWRKSNDPTSIDYDDIDF